MNAVFVRKWLVLSFTKVRFIKNKLTAKNSSVEKQNSCGFLVSYGLMSDEEQIF